MFDRYCMWPNKYFIQCFLNQYQPPVKNNYWQQNEQIRQDLNDNASQTSQLILNIITELQRERQRTNSKLLNKICGAGAGEKKNRCAQELLLPAKSSIKKNSKNMKLHVTFFFLFLKYAFNRYILYSQIMHNKVICYLTN